MTAINGVKKNQDELDRIQGMKKLQITPDLILMDKLANQDDNHKNKVTLTAGSKFFSQKKGSDSGILISDHDHRNHLENYLNSNNVIQKTKELYHKTNN